jgi:hypothetical protein
VNQADDLDGELRRLFRDERLDVRPPVGAEAAILAGTRRIRRRRAMLTATGAALVTVLIAGAVLFFADLRPGHGQPAAPPAAQKFSESGSEDPVAPTTVPLTVPNTGPLSDAGSGAAAQPRLTPSSERRPEPELSSVSPPIAGVPAGSVPILGPDGYGALRLGMSFADAKATGLLAGADTPPLGCGRYGLGEGVAAVAAVTISAKDGIVSFQATGAATPERIRIRSTRHQVEAAYPGLAADAGGYAVPTGAGGRYMFTFDDQNRVDGLLLLGPGSC